MNEKVLCPWCGSEMELEHYGIDEDEYFVYVCPDCAAQSPISYSAESALATALSRPLQKPLTLEEACGSNEPCVFLEMRGRKYIYAADITMAEFVDDGEPLLVTLFGGEKILEAIEYKTTWRCWATKPTDEEREAAKWDD